MRKLMFALAGATALTAASAANAAITIGTTGSTSGSAFNMTSVDNVGVPETLTFKTTSDLGGNYTSFFDFSNDLIGHYNFALITSTSGATITLAQLLNGSSTVLQQVTGTGQSLFLNTGDLAANTTYRFSYTSAFPLGGGATSGNASFYAAAVPEPATWGLMLLGFGGMGLVLRRRRRPVLAQVA